MAKAKPAKSQQRLLTLDEAADYLAVGRTTIYQLLGRGELQAVKIGRCSRFRPEDLELFIDLNMAVRAGGKWTKDGRRRRKQGIKRDGKIS